jgi:hypothetical protein
VCVGCIVYYYLHGEERSKLEESFRAHQFFPVGEEGAAVTGGGGGGGAKLSESQGNNSVAVPVHQKEAAFHDEEEGNDFL